MSGGPLIYLIAGEPSGDLLGGRLMQALAGQCPGVRFAGIGGETMTVAGLQSLFPMADLSVMGVVEVVSHLPRLLRRIDETVGDILARKPDAVVTIDAPDFCFRAARRVRARDPSIKLIHYVAPSVWAWRPGRAAKIARFLDHLLALLPFEPPYFKKAGLGCTFVGHPAVEAPLRGDADRFRQAHNMPPGMPIVTLLPGSRHGEITRLLPLFLAVAQELTSRHGALYFALPTVSAQAGLIKSMLAGFRLPHAVVEGIDAKADAFAASTAALAASGTVALELALAGVPAVIAYRMTPFSAFLARRLVRVSYVSLPNLILDQPVMPEFLQERVTPALIVPEMERLLIDTPERRLQLKAGRKVVSLLRAGDSAPSVLAAQIVLEVLKA